MTGTIKAPKGDRNIIASSDAPSRFFSGGYKKMGLLRTVAEESADTNIILKREQTDKEVLV